MDEVDGMAGNEDRGGMQELILLIKKTSIPVICMCNDRNHPKVRSLANYCFDLKFSKPRVEQIRVSKAYGGKTCIILKSSSIFIGAGLLHIVTLELNPTLALTRNFSNILAQN